MDLKYLSFNDGYNLFSKIIKLSVMNDSIVIYLGLSPVNAITLQVSRNPYLSVIYLDIGPMSVCDGTGEPSLFLRSSPHACYRQFYYK